MLSACSYVYADKFTTCVQNVRFLNASMHLLSRTRHWSMDASMTSCKIYPMVPFPVTLISRSRCNIYAYRCHQRIVRTPDARSVCDS